MTDFLDYTDLASERVGGAVLFANDDFFAPKENLLRVPAAVFLPHEYTERGKWMDGWESRRRRIPGHDFCIIRLGLPGVIRGVIVDTAFFIGNYPAQCSIEACVAPHEADASELLGPKARWVEILPISDLKGDSKNAFAITDPRRFTHLRLHIYPDGGVARLRVHGEVIPDLRRLGSLDDAVDLAAAESGARVLSCSDMFFGNRHNLIMPGRAPNMGDGWETRRRRGPGHDWALIQLAAAGSIERIEVDTNHFKGNYPDTCMIEGVNAEGASLEDILRPDFAFKEILPRTKLQAHTRHFFVDELQKAGDVTHVRINIYPDGGVSRLRLHGRVSRGGRLLLGLRRLNTLIQEDAEAALRTCCGANAWVRAMAERRPFRSLAALFDAADEIGRALQKDDWLEAFACHPKIGEREAKQHQDAAARGFSAQEQSGMQSATDETRAALVEANRAYEAKFGHIFLICATGKSAAEMLAAARRRLENEPSAEIAVAAEEHRQITRIRLEKLLAS